MRALTLGDLAYLTDVSPTGAWTPAALTGRTDWVWYDATDSSLMQVNADGSGGTPGVGAGVGRLQDKSGNALHLSFNTARPLRQSGYLSFPNTSANSGSRPRLRNSTGIASATTQAMTGMIVMETMGVWEDGQWPFDWDLGTGTGRFGLLAGNGNNLLYRLFLNGGIVATTLPIPTRRVAIAWRGSASGFEFWINGQSWTRAALTLQTLSGFQYAHGAGGFPVKTRLRESVLVGAALSDADFNGLRAYGEQVAGVSTLTVDRFLALGDSMTGGVGSDACLPYPDRMTHMANARQANFGREGGVTSHYSTSFLNSILSNYAPGAGRNMCTVWLGTNNIIGQSQTGLAVYNELQRICNQMRTGGYKVVVATLQAMAGGNATEIADCNSRLRSGFSGFADGLADLAARSELSNTADTTFYRADGVHLTDAGHQVVADVFNAACAAVP